MDSLFPTHDRLQEQRRALAEETVSYAIYLLPYTESEGGPLNDSMQDQNEFQVELESVQLAKTLISSIVTELAQGYIWQKDAFSLRVEHTTSDRPYLRGETRIGDSLDDEWLIVFLLREITRRIPGSVARIQDNDGEFLLIEAADFIPSWLDPDNSENRVFIYNGNLHIIPIAVTAEEKTIFPSTVGTKTRSPKLQDALDMIRSSSHAPTKDKGNDSEQIAVPTLASLKIQQAAFAPILSDSSQQHFAARKIIDQKHHARCQIPVNIARILKARPELVTRACEAFYTRDALAMATCSRMKMFLPAPSEVEKVTTLPLGTTRLGKNETPFITTTVCFTKTCYAQLMGQQFRPPKIWDGIIPPHPTDDSNDLQKFKEAELGMKLTCGFEILCSPEYPGDFGFKGGVEFKVEASGCKRTENFPFATDSGWRTFKNNLTNRKYFRDERPGSQAYRQLEETAKSQFLEYKTAQLSASEESDEPVLGSVSFHGHGYHPVEEIERILGATPNNDLIINLVNDREGDDDSWMDVDLPMLEDMMHARGFGGAAMKETDQSSKAGFDMQQMLGRFEEFVQEGKGGIEGAEFMDEQSSESEDEDEDEDEKDEDIDTEESNRLPNLNESIDPNEQEHKNRRVAGEEDDDDDDIFASDYEERQAKKQAAKRGNDAGAFIFGSDMMSFDNSMAVDSSDTEIKVANSLQTFGLDREKFKNILTKNFGDRSATSRTKGGLNRGGGSDGEGNDGNADIEMDEQGLQDYMAALDAELSETKMGESFEKMPAAIFREVKTSTPSSAPGIVDPSTKAKGKGVHRGTNPPKPEKNLEELVKEYAARSRRGFGRQGPLSTSGNQYGYDPSAVAFADDEDDDEDDDELNTPTARISAISPEDEVDEKMTDDEDENEGEIVDVDLNLAKNLLESFKSQGGLPGPGGNLLSRLGIVLPRDVGNDEEEDED
ncbi:hypothetical protein BGX27_006612 [Mortierella sp. AM989]|nr:hypothetical protein BGX27_006612 [Mortierella sp. AM989]